MEKSQEAVKRTTAKKPAIPPLRVIEGLKGRYGDALEKADASSKKPGTSPAWGGNPFGYLSRNA